MSRKCHDSGIFSIFLLVLVAFWLVSQHVSAAGTPQALPFYIDGARDASICALPVPGICLFPLCGLVFVTYVIASHWYVL